MANIIGVDLGGTLMRIAAVDDEKLSLTSSSVVHSSPSDIGAFINLLLKHSNPDCQGIGVAVAGVVQDHSKIISCPSLHWLDGIHLKKHIEDKLHLTAVISNDMEAAAIGENEKGILHKYEWAIFDTISTGWGGILKLDNKLIDGEPGHVNVSFNKKYRCGCGNWGCVESMYSGSALEKRILNHMKKKVCKAHEPWLFFHKELANESQWATNLINEWAEGVGRAWANVLNRIRPIQAIIYMGTTADKLVPKAKKQIRSTIQKICMFPEHKAATFPIVKATEKNRSVIGAVRIYQQLTNK